MSVSLIKIRPIVQVSQVDRIELNLQRYFRTENFLPGDVIPKETDLAKAMGVSRTAIRGAIARFKTLGIIESKRKTGMVISRPDVLINMERVVDSRLLDGVTMQEMFEMRLVLEMGLGDILFLRKTASGMARLEETVNKEENTKNKKELLKYDVEFHSQLYALAENKTIQRFQKILLPVFEYVNNSLRVPRQVKNSDYVSHRVLLNTLKNGTPDEFRKKMKSHLLNYFEKIKKG
ncbi:MAG: FCD domain-containing protein [Puia sp.]